VGSMCSVFFVSDGLSERILLASIVIVVEAKLSRGRSHGKGKI
jgi:hypothetical protein